MNGFDWNKGAIGYVVALVGLFILAYVVGRGFKTGVKAAG